MTPTNNQPPQTEEWEELFAPLIEQYGIACAGGEKTVIVESLKSIKPFIHTHIQAAYRRGQKELMKRARACTRGECPRGCDICGDIAVKKSKN